MNIPRSLSFRFLIKIFLPGFMIFVAMLMLTDSILAASPSDVTIFSWIERNALLGALAAVPTSLIAGIFSNMIFYLYLTDRLVRKPFKAKAENRKLVGLKEALGLAIIRHYTNNAALSADIKEQISVYCDPRFFILPRLELEKLTFVQESYWAYLEFQLNTMFAVLVLFLCAMTWCISRATWRTIGFPAWWILSGVGLLLTVGVAVLCLTCARKNYAKHTEKMVSLVAGAFCI